MHIITVMAASVNGKVVLWEVNPQHPSGEIYISGDGRAVQVALTPAVQQKLDAQMLIKVVTVHDEPAPAVETQPVSDEPVPGYDSMTALAVVELSHALTDDERASVLAYETVHDEPAPAVETQPVSDEPVPGYDSMTALAVVELSHALTDDERASVLAYETVHKNRATVLRALQ